MDPAVHHRRALGGPGSAHPAGDGVRGEEQQEGASAASDQHHHAGESELHVAGSYGVVLLDPPREHVILHDSTGQGRR